jgi:hypothetical protein
MKYHTGDKVKILPFRKEWRYMSPDYVMAMAKYAGQVVQIKGSPYAGCYYLYGVPFMWHEDWLEPVNILESELFEI